MAIEERLIVRLFKYFIHGLLFSLVFVTLSISGLSVFFYTGITIIAGLIFYGFINSLITSRLWKIPMKSDYWSFFEHGFILIWPLAGINLFLALIFYPILNIWTTILMFFLQCFPRGFVCKLIAQRYEEDNNIDISKIPKYD